jgi:TPR repeat protein
MYEHGNGVGRDEVAALRWYERAQAGGDEVAPLKVEQLRLRLAATGQRLRRH